MPELKKPIWVEGLLLSQQHFQQWEQYIEQSLQFRIQAIAPLGWGIKSLIIDEDALLHRQCRVLSCAVIFPQGYIAQYNHSHDYVLSCELPIVSGNKAEIYLCIPMSQCVTGISGYQSPLTACAWSADYQPVADCYDINRQREVLFGRLNLMLLLGDHAKDLYYKIKIAEVESLSDCSYRLIKTYIAPCVYVEASSNMQRFLNKLLQTLATIILNISEQRQQMALRGQEFHNKDLRLCLLQQIFNQHQVFLKHLQVHTKSHPQQLYLIIAHLVNSLTVFDRQYVDLPIPSYQHEQLGVVFEELEKLLNNLLKNIMPVEAAILELHKKSDFLYVAENVESEFLEKYHLYIAVKYPSEDEQWTRYFAKQVKVAAKTTLNTTIVAALSGIKLIYKNRLPNDLSIKPGYEYFYLEPYGESWQQIINEKSIAIFLPHDFIKAQIELLTIEIKDAKTK